MHYNMLIVHNNGIDVPRENDTIICYYYRSDFHIHINSVSINFDILACTPIFVLLVLIISLLIE